MPENQVLAVLSLLGGILLFVLVLVLAWLCTRWLGMRYSGFRIGGAVEVLDRTAIGPDRTLVIVRAGGKVWMLGVTPQNITFLGAGYQKGYGFGIRCHYGGFFTGIAGCHGKMGFGKEAEKG